jgi:hypothetical protein
VPAPEGWCGTVGAPRPSSSGRWDMPETMEGEIARTGGVGIGGRWRAETLTRRSGERGTEWRERREGGERRPLFFLLSFFFRAYLIWRLLRCGGGLDSEGKGQDGHDSFAL